MVIGPDVSRSVEPPNYEEVDELLRAAFEGPVEADLVARLRAGGDMWFEMAKPWEGQTAGYAALSRMRAPDGWACLAPVAVLPKYQNGASAPSPNHTSPYRIGTRLVSEIVYVLNSNSQRNSEKRDFPTTIVVVGKPSFYERAGFSSSRAQKLNSPYPLEYTLIARPGDDVPSETLIYPRAFGELS